MVYAPLSAIVFSTDCTIAVPLVQFLSVCASEILNMALVLSLFVPHLSFFWCLRKA